MISKTPKIDLMKRSEYFAKFESENHDYLISIIRAKVPGTDIQDVYQNALLNIWAAFNRSMEEIDAVRNPRALAARIARRQVANFWRNRNHRLETRQLTIDPPDPGPRFPEPKEEKMINPTSAEKTILWLIGLGLSNDDMAERLHVSLNTVRTHVKHIHKKTGIKGRTELALFAAKYIRPNAVRQGGKT